MIAKALNAELQFSLMDRVASAGSSRIADLPSRWLGGFHRDADSEQEFGKDGSIGEAVTGTASFSLSRLVSHGAEKEAVPSEILPHTAA
jgi:hypothetical protein